MLVKRWLLLLVFATTGLAAGLATGATRAEVTDSTSPEAGLELLRSMAGDWYEVGADGDSTDTVVSRVRVTSGGNAVHELHFPGTEMEMLTVYFIEAGELRLVHYCVLGNQPQMRAVELSEGALAFECTGIEDEDESHMHAAHIESVSPGHNHVEWVNWDGGERNHALALDLVRR